MIGAAAARCPRTVTTASDSAAPMITNSAAGLEVAYDAYHRSLGGKEAPVIDGLTGDQRFFLAFAQAWRDKARDDAIKQQVASDPHSPSRWRIIGPLRNVDAWYKAFNVPANAKYYLKPEARTRIW